jgi:demethylmenaquinone methyltransferase/2-methoxy-6-polyprenyl-1,4-benzoquinol methylase
MPGVPCFANLLSCFMPAAEPHTEVPAWRDEELVNPHVVQEKPAKVRQMFASIARSYDLNNRLHSLWQDQRWRRFAVQAAEIHPGERVLDVACGTGDLTEAFARTEAVEVIGLDFTREMLEMAQHKRGRLPKRIRDRIRYMEGDAMSLPFEGGSVDVVSIAFGIRNVSDPRRALREFGRVLRPGGRLVILEFDRPQGRFMRWFNNLYCTRIMPRTAAWIAGDRSGAYQYLPASVGAFLSREEMLREIESTGFRSVAGIPLTFGICICYRAVKT